jgi:hypothetical protein
MAGGTAGGGRWWVLLLPLVAAGSLAAQAKQPARFEMIFDAGFSGNAAVGFSEDQICTSRTAWSFGARLHRDLGSRFAAEITGQLFANLAGQHCVDGLIPPPPPTGPYTYRYSYYDTRVVGYPFAVSGLRVQFVPLNGAAGALRVSVGVSRIWAKRITVPQAGVAVVLGRRRVRTLLEADTWWYRVPRHRLTLNYLDGQLVSAQDAVAGVRASTIVLRAGLIIPLGHASD